MGAALLLQASCGAPSRHQIDTAELTARPDAPGAVELSPRIDVGGVGGAPPATAQLIDAETARGGVGSISVESGDPEEPLFVVGGEEDAPAPAPQEPVIERVMIDSVVGHINGRPVFASEFFEPMEARLRAQSQTLSSREWIQMAQREIRGRLRDLIRDELLLAEFESSLSIEQRSGLLHFVSQIRENLVSQSRGSAELLAQKLQEEEGVTIDEKVEEERRKALIREQLRAQLGDKAYVPWRDVLLQYKQDEAIYNPAPTARLRMIQVNADDTEAIERVEAALADRLPFAEIAQRNSAFRPDEGGLYEVELSGDSYEESRIFAPDELNDTAVKLSPGEHAGPVETSSGRRLAWLYLEEIERDSVSLYDVQFAIYEALRDERLLEEEAKYFQSLIDRSSLSPIQEMERRLVEIASTRYLIEDSQ